MSGRSRGRKSSRAKGRGKGRHKGRARAAPAAADASRAPAAPQSDAPGDDAAQVAAGAGWAGLDAAAPGADPDAELPLDCGLALRARRAAGCGGFGGARPCPAKATSLAERLVADTVFVGTAGLVGRPRSGPRAGGRRGPVGRKAPEARGAAARAGAGAKARRGGAAAPEGGGHGPGDDEKPAEPDPGSAAPAPAADGSMDTLETVQLKLETMNAQADRAYLRLSRKFGQLRLHHLERRNLLIQNIPGFWGQAFQNHPQLAAFLNQHDRELLGYLNSLEVEELGLARLGYKIKLYFGRNPYFQNKVLIKEYGCGPSGQVVSRSTPIQWLPGHDLQAILQSNADRDEDGRSFFGWFINHSSIESDKIVEIINEELWPNPLQYYLLGEAARAEKAKEGEQDPAKQPAEPPPVPGPDAGPDASQNADANAGPNASPRASPDANANASASPNASANAGPDASSGPDANSGPDTGSNAAN